MTTPNREPRSEILTLQGKRIHYIHTGKADGLSILFLHGARFSARDWLSVGCLKVLAESGYGALALDLPGFGESERVALQPRIFIEHFTQAIGLTRFILVGPSMGGQIALHSALEDPNGLEGLVLYAPVGLPPLKERLKEIQIPILLMWGDKDRVISPSHANLLTREVKDVDFHLIRGAGHTGYFDYPGKFNKILRDFVIRLDRKGTIP